MANLSQRSSRTFWPSTTALPMRLVEAANREVEAANREVEATHPAAGVTEALSE